VKAFALRSVYIVRTQFGSFKPDGVKNIGGMDMSDIGRQTGGAFDFSQDAAAFKANLWKRLQENKAENGIQLLEDDDLTWINAAGVPHRAVKDELPE